MSKQIRYDLKLYREYISRVKYCFTDVQKIDAEVLSELLDYGRFNVKRYVAGTQSFLRCRKKHPDLFSKKNSNPSQKTDRDTALMMELVGHKLFLFPAYSPQPFKAQITLTTECNARCTHCFQGGTRSKRHVKRSDVKLFLDKLQEVNIPSVGLQGGEAFMYPELLFEIIGMASSRGMAVTITTNGFWCENEKTILDYLQRLKTLEFQGWIKISLGLGHDEFQKPEWFRNLRQYSKQVLGKNIFLFSIEALSKEDFLKKREECRKTIGNYYYPYQRIACVGAANSLRDEIKKRNPVRECAGECASVGPHLMPDGTISFCLGSAPMLPEYNLGRLTKDTTFAQFMKGEKLPALLRRFKGEQLYEALEKSNSNEFPYYCDLCIHLSRNPELIDLLHEHLVNGK